MRYPDVVVLVPGILGSVLTKDGKSIWDLSPGAMTEVALGSQLSLKAQGSRDEDIDDGISATSVIHNVGLVPGLWKLGGYSHLSENLVKKLGLARGENFFEFPYDWRRDNRVAADRLARESYAWLKSWRIASGNPDAKLVIIAHSMGGLVARYFIECLEGWKTTRSLLAIGTPFKGAGKALNFLSNDLSSFAATALMPGLRAFSSFDSLYQLLPTYPFINDAEGQKYRVSEIDVTGISRERAASALALHEETQLHRNANLREGGYRESSDILRVIVGTEQLTLQSARVDGRGSIKCFLTEMSGKNHYGDGTVARISATPLDYRENSGSYFVNSHSGLTSDTAVLAHLRGSLSEVNVDLDAYRDSTEAVRLSVNDLYLSDEDVQIFAETESYSQYLEVKIRRLDLYTKDIALRLMYEDDAFVGALRLPAGLYQVSLVHRSHSISDIFLVRDRQ